MLSTIPGHDQGAARVEESVKEDPETLEAVGHFGECVGYTNLLSFTDNLQAEHSGGRAITEVIVDRDCCNLIWDWGVRYVVQKGCMPALRSLRS